MNEIPSESDTVTRFYHRWMACALVVVFAAALVAWGATKLAERTGPPRIDGMAPDFMLESSQGQKVSLTEQRGKPTVVVFVASWCDVCREEMPTMVETFRAHQEHSIVFLGVDVFEDVAVVEQFRQEFQIPFPLLVDANGEVSQRYRVNGTPTTFFIDPAGVLRDVVVGGPLERDYLNKEIATLRAPRAFNTLSNLVKSSSEFRLFSSVRPRQIAYSKSR